MKKTIVNVQAVNGFNKNFGIEMGAVYSAEKIFQSIFITTADRYGNNSQQEEIVDISYKINGVLHQADDFKEI